MEEIDRQFKATRWTTVLQAGRPDAPGADLALEQLCLDYRRPLFEFARHWLPSPQEAEDLNQGFFAHFIARNLPGAVSRQRGKFRSFLIASFKNYIRDEWRKQRRAREIPTELLTRIDADEHQEGRPVDPAFTPALEREMDLLWARNIRENVIQRLAEDFAGRGKRALFEKLLPMLLGQPALSYGEIAASAGTTEGAIKVEVHRLRGKFRDYFRAEVANTVSSAEELEGECRYLLSILFAGEGAEARP